MNSHIIKYYNHKRLEAWGYYDYWEEFKWWKKLYKETGIKPESLKLFGEA